jgi:magnesium-transporting ATPase (P-type)
LVKVRRIDTDGNYKDIFSSSKHLVPGDIIIISTGENIPCDIVIF